MIQNRAKEQLEKGDLALGLGLRHNRTVDMGRVLATCGFDFAFIDMEHSPMEVQTATSIAVACQDAGVTPLVRVPHGDRIIPSRLLDGGAMGIVFPHVDSPEEARDLVGLCRFPPAGHRSIGGPQVQLGFKAVPQAEAMAEINNGLLVVAMVESPEAVDSAEEIAAVEGVDVLLIGTNDLCLEMGIPQQYDDPRVIAAFEKVIAACQKHGKHPGFGGVYDEERTQRFVEMGSRFILAGGDLGMLMGAASRRTAFLRGLKL